jgi:hypothetical protein
MSATKFRVVPVNSIFKGKTYSQWIADWTNWFFMQYPDQYNSEPWNDVKFLTSFPSPDTIAQLGNPGERIRYEGSEFGNIPNIKTGENMLVMYDDQAIFFPVILAMWINSDEKDYGYMERWVKNQNSVSDDPPPVHQFTLDNLPLLPSAEVVNHRIMSNGLFQVRIPDAPYGTSLKDFVFEPSQPGLYDAVCEGYFFMLKDLEARDEPYRLMSFATGASYPELGEYHAAFVYEIRVLSRDLKPRPPQAGIFPENILSFIDKKTRETKAGQDKSDSVNAISESVTDFRKADLGYTKYTVFGRKTAQDYAISCLVLGNIKRKIPSSIQGRKAYEKIDIDKINSMLKSLEDSISPSADHKSQSNVPENFGSQDEIDLYPRGPRIRKGIGRRF